LLRRQLDGQTVLLFVVWFFFCIFLTGSGAMQVGNAAHFGGFAFGALYAFAFLDRNAVFWKRLTVAVSILAFFPLIYAPWLSAWQLMRAQKAYEAGNYQAALDRYDRVHLDGFQLYVQEERAECFSRLGREADAVQVYKDLLASDTANAGDDLGALYNSYAWLLASSPDDKLRDPTQAIVYAQKACDSDGNSNSDSLDTLAVAYAAAGQFDQAVTWEQKAIAVEKNEKDLADLRAHLQLFEQKKPYRDTLGGGI
jgi:tetratricopeptide (TPR) repeat protein